MRIFKAILSAETVQHVPFELKLRLSVGDMKRMRVGA
jgi:hypothetical protein